MSQWHHLLSVATDQGIEVEVEDEAGVTHIQAPFMWAFSWNGELPEGANREDNSGLNEWITVQGRADEDEAVARFLTCVVCNGLIPIEEA